MGNGATGSTPGFGPGGCGFDSCFPSADRTNNMPSRFRRFGIRPWYGRGWRFESARGLSCGRSVNGRTPSCHAGRAGSNPVAHSKPI